MQVLDAFSLCCLLTAAIQVGLWLGAMHGWQAKPLLQEVD